MEDQAFRDTLTVLEAALLLFLLIGTPFVLAPLIEHLARRGHPQTSSDQPGGKPRQSILAYAAVVTPLLALPAWIGAAALIDWLADAGVLAPYPPSSWAFVLGGWSAALLGLILGVVALVQVTRRPDQVAGRDRARAGIALSWWAAGAIAFMLPMANAASQSPRKAACLSHVKRLTMALRMYAADNGGVLPDASRWCDLVAPYVEERWGFVCPKARKLRCGYAYNANLSGRKLDDIREPDTVVAFFESNAGWNAHGGPELLVKEPRHLGGDNYGFADGHAAWVSRATMAEGTGTEYRWSR